MEHVNEIHVRGLLVKEPYAKQVGANKRWVAMGKLACDREFKGRKFTSYVPFKAWGDSAEACSDLKPGTVIDIKGRWDSYNYEDKDGIKKYGDQVTVDELEVMASPSDDDVPF